MIESYKTHVFEGDKKKILKSRFMYLILAMLIIALIILILLELSTFAYGLGITLFIYLYQLYSDNREFEGINAYGKRKAPLIIAQDFLVIDKTEIPFKDLKKFTIYVDEYTGMPRDLIGRHHGGNNEINFEHNQQQVKFNYIIKSKPDFKNLNLLVDKIEGKYPNANSK